MRLLTLFAAAATVAMLTFAGDVIAGPDDDARAALALVLAGPPPACDCGPACACKECNCDPLPTAARTAAERSGLVEQPGNPWQWDAAQSRWWRPSRPDLPGRGDPATLAVFTLTAAQTAQCGGGTCTAGGCSSGACGVSGTCSGGSCASGVCSGGNCATGGCAGGSCGVPARGLFGRRR